jgi:hypothetical protein
VVEVAAQAQPVLTVLTEVALPEVLRAAWAEPALEALTEMALAARVWTVALERMAARAVLLVRVATVAAARFAGRTLLRRKRR